MGSTPLSLDRLCHCQKSSDFLDIGVYGFEEDFENKEEDEDDSKLAVYDPWSSGRTGDAREDKENKEDEDDDSYYRRLYGR